MSKELKERILKALKNVYDPEIPINIVDLGLIYDVIVKDGHVKIRMTLTAPGCPIYAFLQQLVESAVMEVEGVEDVEVEFVWDPPWTPLRMTKEGREAYKAIFGYDIVEVWRRTMGASQK